LQAKHNFFTYYTVRALTLQNYVTWYSKKKLNQTVDLTLDD